jgi:hypothetical protein
MTKEECADEIISDMIRHLYGFGKSKAKFGLFDGAEFSREEMVAILGDFVVYRNKYF